VFFGGQRGTRDGALPSVVGMAYNVNEMLAMTGHYFFREQNKTIITDLAKELSIPILEYKNRSKGRAWPSHIFIYRAGVSEGEYTQVVRFEKSALIQCFSELKKSHRDFIMPGFTFIIAQRNNGFRLFPKNPPPNAQKDFEQNLQPGTCITKGIVNPSFEQFILIAHRTIMGSCRPMLYTVLADKGKNGKDRIPLDQLKYITYALCHLHNDVLGTIHAPACLFHAGQVAKRGRNNLKMKMFGSADDQSTESSGSKKKYDEGPGKDFIDSLAEDLKVTLKGKYWA